MSSFTSKEIRNFAEVYKSIHLSEEEIFLSVALDEVTESINLLVSEGWDFSEYSWDEIYESFLDNFVKEEIDIFKEAVSQLNESTEELSEEELFEVVGFLSGLLRGASKAKKVKQATSATGAVSKPSILQAPLAGGTKPPSTAPLQAPTKPLNITKPLPPSVTGGTQQGGVITRFGNWLGSLGKSKPPVTKPPSTTAAPAATTKPVTPPPAAPSGTAKPTGQTTVPSLGLRSALKKTGDIMRPVTRALTPGPRAKTAALGALKYGVGVPGTVGLTAAPFVSAWNLAKGRPSGLQQLSGYTQGATGNVLQTTARVMGAAGSVDAPGMFELGRQLKQAGSDTQKEVERKRRSQLGTGKTGRTGATDSTTGLPVYDSYDLDGDENLNEVLAYDKENDRWYDVTKNPDGSVKSRVEVSPTQTAIDRYNRLIRQQQETQKTDPRPTPEPAKPAKPEPATPDPKPATPEPAKPAKPATPEPAKPATPEPAKPAKPATPEPAKPATPAPQQGPVAKYMAAAAAARKSGNPEEMARVRDMGMAIWRDKYKDTLAKKVDFKSRPTGRQIGTGQSQMAKQAAELRAMRPTTTAQPTATQPTTSPKPDTAVSRVQAVSQPAGTSLTTQAQQQGIKPLDTTKLERSRVRRQTGSTGMVSASYEPYDLVLGYLISEGHADTVEEANYIMMQMDAENIQSIVETLSI